MICILCLGHTALLIAVYYFNKNVHKLQCDRVFKFRYLLKHKYIGWESIFDKTTYILFLVEFEYRRLRYEQKRSN